MRYTHDYLTMYKHGAHGSSYFIEFYTKLFEEEAKEHLKGLKHDDVGGVICYMDLNGEEAAYFDYENLVGSIYSITGKRSYEV